MEFYYQKFVRSMTLLTLITHEKSSKSDRSNNWFGVDGIHYFDALRSNELG